MNTPSREEIKQLMTKHGGVYISMFLPADKGPEEIQKRRISLVQQVKEVEHHLQGEYASLVAAPKKLLKPVYALLDDEKLWQSSGDSLALLLTQDEFHCYRIPFECQELVVMTDHFDLKPLLPLLNADQHFFLLGLSQNAVRLFDGTPFDLTAMPLPDTVPQDLAHSLGHEERENLLQYDSSGSGNLVGKGGRRAVVFHGQGVGIDDAKDDVLRYFRQIDRGLHGLFHQQHAPLVLASVEFLQPIYREANSYPHLIEPAIVGNPDKMNAQTLLQQAWPLVEPYVLKTQYEALERYQANTHADWTSANSSEIVPAAYYGKVSDLFVALDLELWGTFESNTHTVQVHQKRVWGDDDLLELAARQTLLHGGHVYGMKQQEMPEQTLLAAIFRF